MSHKDRIIELISAGSSGFVDRIKRHPDLVEWVKENTLSHDGNFAEQVYSAIHQEGNMCKHGNKKKYKGIGAGYSFCGKTTTCKCNFEKQSADAKARQRNMTVEERERIRKKREESYRKRTGFNTPFENPEIQQKAKSAAKVKSRGKLYTPEGIRK